MNGWYVLTILSNLFFIIPSIRAFYMYRYFRSIVYFVMIFASGAYHACDSFDACIFDADLHHHLDFFFAQLIIVLSGLYIVYFPIEKEYWEYWLIVIGGLTIVVLQATLPGELTVQAGLCGIIFAGIVIYWVYQKGTYGKIPKYRWDMFLTGISLLAGSVMLYTIQNIWYQNYWGVHSLWHVAAALGQDFFLRIKPPAHWFQTAASRVRK